MIISDCSHSPENIPPVLHSNSPPNLTPQLPHDLNFHRRTIRNPVVCGSLVPRWQNESPATRLRGQKLRKPNHFAGVPAACPMISRRLVANDETNFVSVRKLAAGLWKLTAAEVDIASAVGGGGGILHYEGLDPLRFEDKSSLPFSEFPLEGATKWDLVYRNVSTGTSRHLICEENLKHQEVALDPIVTFLKAKLEQVGVLTMKLKAEHKSCKKEAVLCLRKLGEEKTSWMRREHQKLHAIIDGLKSELKRERLGRKRVQIANSQLLNDIADAKSAVKEILQNYEKERKTRESMEESFHELAKKIEEEKLKMEDVKKKSSKLREQLEVERKMLQMADIWREERVKIKMADAKLIFEEKFCQLNNLIADLEDFLRSKDESRDMIEISEGEVIRQATKSADIKEIIDLLCSTIDDHQNNQVRSRKSNHSVDSKCAQNVPKIEGNSHTDDRKSTDKTISTTSVLTGHESLKSEISDMCSAILAKKLTRKPLSLTWQLKQFKRDSDVNEIIPVERRGKFGKKRSIPKIGRVSPAGTLVEGGLKESVQVGNPHITRAMKGCLEWPQGRAKNDLKGKLLDSTFSHK